METYQERCKEFHTLEGPRATSYTWTSHYEIRVNEDYLVTFNITTRRNLLLATSEGSETYVSADIDRELRKDSGGRALCKKWTDLIKTFESHPKTRYISDFSSFTIVAFQPLENVPMDSYELLEHKTAMMASIVNRIEELQKFFEKEGENA